MTKERTLTIGPATITIGGTSSYPFWQQWALKATTPGGMSFMLPGVRIYGVPFWPSLPPNTFVHITAGKWKSKVFYRGEIHSVVVAVR